MTTASWHRPELKMARSCATRISAGCSTSGGMWAKDAQRRSPLCRLFHLCPRHTHLSLCVVNLYAEPCQCLTPLIVAGFAYLPQEVFVGQTLRPSRTMGLHSSVARPQVQTSPVKEVLLPRASAGASPARVAAAVQVSRCDWLPYARCACSWCSCATLVAPCLRKRSLELRVHKAGLQATLSEQLRYR